MVSWKLLTCFLGVCMTTMHLWTVASKCEMMDSMEGREAPKLSLNRSNGYFEKRNWSKDETINKLSATLKNITNNLLLKDPTVALNNNNLLPETAPSNYNENTSLSAGDCSIQHIVKDKGDYAILTSFSRINK